MYKTVVIDGDGSLGIEKAIGSYTIEDATGEVSITTDGGGTVSIVGEAEGELEYICDGEMGIVTEVSSSDIPYYTGQYTVIPTMENQTLETRNKVLTDDVTVKKIPMYETTNLAGGTTVYIAMGEE